MTQAPVQPSERPVDHDDLRAFLAVVGQGSFIRAARSLGVPRSVVSRRVAALEARVGLRLLVRTTRTVTVTDAGRALAQELAGALDAIEQALRAAALASERPRGRVRVTAPRVFGDELLAPLVAPFLARHPEVQVELALLDRRVDLVAEGFDVALRAAPLADSSLLVRRLGPAESCLVASPRYLRAHGAPERPAELRAHRWCVFQSEAPGPTSLRLRGQRGSVSLDVRPVFATTSQLALRRCILDGVGLGVLPWYLARDPLARGELVEPLPSLRGPPATLQLLTHAGRATSAVRAFVAMLDETFAAERPWVRPSR